MKPLGAFHYKVPHYRLSTAPFSIHLHFQIVQDCLILSLLFSIFEWTRLIIYTLLERGFLTLAQSSMFSGLKKTVTEPPQPKLSNTSIPSLLPFPLSTPILSVFLSVFPNRAPFFSVGTFDSRGALRTEASVLRITFGGSVRGAVGVCFCLGQEDST